MQVLRDVQGRLRALAEARRLRAEVDSATEHLRRVKRLAAEAAEGSAEELNHLHEAGEANRRLAALRTALGTAETELRRTEYLLRILSE